MCLPLVVDLAPNAAGRLLASAGWSGVAADVGTDGVVGGSAECWCTTSVGTGYMWVQNSWRYRGPFWCRSRDDAKSTLGQIPCWYTFHLGADPPLSQTLAGAGPMPAGELPAGTHMYWHRRGIHIGTGAKFHINVNPLMCQILC